MIGRNRSQVDFLLDSANPVASQYVSRLHARVVKQESNLHRLYDDSLNGIFINNTKMNGSVILQEGDIVTFGHPFGAKLPAGVWKRQPDSEYQFLFEKCTCQPTAKKSKSNILEDEANVKMPSKFPQDPTTKSSKPGVESVNVVLSAARVLDHSMSSECIASSTLVSTSMPGCPDADTLLKEDDITSSHSVARQTDTARSEGPFLVPSCNDTVVGDSFVGDICEQEEQSAREFARHNQTTFSAHILCPTLDGSTTIITNKSPSAPKGKLLCDLSITYKDATTAEFPEQESNILDTELNKLNQVTAEHVQITSEHSQVTSCHEKAISNHDQVPNEHSQITSEPSQVTSKYDQVMEANLDTSNDIDLISHEHSSTPSIQHHSHTSVIPSAYMRKLVDTPKMPTSQDVDIVKNFTGSITNVASASTSEVTHVAAVTVADTSDSLFTGDSVVSSTSVQSTLVDCRSRILHTSPFTPCNFSRTGENKVEPSTQDIYICAAGYVVQTELSKTSCKMDLLTANIPVDSVCKVSGCVSKVSGSVCKVSGKGSRSETVSQVPTSVMVDVFKAICEDFDEEESQEAFGKELKSLVEKIMESPPEKGFSSTDCVGPTSDQIKAASSAEVTCSIPAVDEAISASRTAVFHPAINHSDSASRKAVCEVPTIPCEIPSSGQTDLTCRNVVCEVPSVIVTDSETTYKNKNIFFCEGIQNVTLDTKLDEADVSVQQINEPEKLKNDQDSSTCHVEVDSNTELPALVLDDTITEIKHCHVERGDVDFHDFSEQHHSYGNSDQTRLIYKFPVEGLSDQNILSSQVNYKTSDENETPSSKDNTDTSSFKDTGIDDIRLVQEFESNMNFHGNSAEHVSSLGEDTYPDNVVNKKYENLKFDLVTKVKVREDNNEHFCSKYNNISSEKKQEWSHYKVNEKELLSENCDKSVNVMQCVTNQSSNSSDTNTSRAHSLNVINGENMEDQLSSGTSEMRMKSNTSPCWIPVCEQIPTEGEFNFSNMAKQYAVTSSSKMKQLCEMLGKDKSEQSNNSEECRHSGEVIHGPDDHYEEVRNLVISNYVCVDSNDQEQNNVSGDKNSCEHAADLVDEINCKGSNSHVHRDYHIVSKNNDLGYCQGLGDDLVENNERNGDDLTAKNDHRNRDDLHINRTNHEQGDLHVDLNYQGLIDDLCEKKNQELKDNINIDFSRQGCYDEFHVDKNSRRRSDDLHFYKNIHDHDVHHLESKSHEDNNDIYVGKNSHKNSNDQFVKNDKEHCDVLDSKRNNHAHSNDFCVKESFEHDDLDVNMNSQGCSDDLIDPHAAKNNHTQCDYYRVCRNCPEHADILHDGKSSQKDSGYMCIVKNSQRHKDDLDFGQNNQGNTDDLHGDKKSQVDNYDLHLDRNSQSSNDDLRLDKYSQGDNGNFLVDRNSQSNNNDLNVGKSSQGNNDDLHVDRNSQGSKDDLPVGSNTLGNNGDLDVGRNSQENNDDPVGSNSQGNNGDLDVGRNGQGNNDDPVGSNSQGNNDDLDVGRNGQGNNDDPVGSNSQDNNDDLDVGRNGQGNNDDPVGSNSQGNNDDLDVGRNGQGNNDDPVGRNSQDNNDDLDVGRNGQGNNDDPVGSNSQDNNDDLDVGRNGQGNNDDPVGSNSQGNNDDLDVGRNGQGNNDDPVGRNSQDNNDDLVGWNSQDNNDDPVGRNSQGNNNYLDVGKNSQGNNGDLHVGSSIQDSNDDLDVGINTQDNNDDLDVGSNNWDNNDDLDIGSNNSDNNDDLDVGSNNRDNNDDLDVGSNNRDNNDDLDVGSNNWDNNDDLDVGSNSQGNNDDLDVGSNTQDNNDDLDVGSNNWDNNDDLDVGSNNRDNNDDRDVGSNNWDNNDDDLDVGSNTQDNNDDLDVGSNSQGNNDDLVGRSSQDSYDDHVGNNGDHIGNNSQGNNDDLHVGSNTQGNNDDHVGRNSQGSNGDLDVGKNSQGNNGDLHVGSNTQGNNDDHVGRNSQGSNGDLDVGKNSQGNNGDLHVGSNTQGNNDDHVGRNSQGSNGDLDVGKNSQCNNGDLHVGSNTQGNNDDHVGRNSQGSNGDLHVGKNSQGKNGDLHVGRNSQRDNNDLHFDNHSQKDNNKFLVDTSVPEPCGDHHMDRIREKDSSAYYVDLSNQGQIGDLTDKNNLENSDYLIWKNSQENCDDLLIDKNKPEHHSDLIADKYNQKPQTLLDYQGTEFNKKDHKFSQETLTSQEAGMKDIHFSTSSITEKDLNLFTSDIHSKSIKINVPISNSEFHDKSALQEIKLQTPDDVNLESMGGCVEADDSTYCKTTFVKCYSPDTECLDKEMSLKIPNSGEGSGPVQLLQKYCVNDTVNKIHHREDIACSIVDEIIIASSDNKERIVDPSTDEVTENSIVDPSTDEVTEDSKIYLRFDEDTMAISDIKEGIVLLSTDEVSAGDSDTGERIVYHSTDEVTETHSDIKEIIVCIRTDEVTEESVVYPSTDEDTMAIDIKESIVFPSTDEVTMANSDIKESIVFPSTDEVTMTNSDIKENIVFPSTDEVTMANSDIKESIVFPSTDEVSEESIVCLSTNEAVIANSESKERIVYPSTDEVTAANRDNKEGIVYNSTCEFTTDMSDTNEIKFYPSTDEVVKESIVYPSTDEFSMANSDNKAGIVYPSTDEVTTTNSDSTGSIVYPITDEVSMANSDNKESIVYHSIDELITTKSDTKSHGRREVPKNRDNFRDMIYMGVLQNDVNISSSEGQQEADDCHDMAKKMANDDTRFLISVEEPDTKTNDEEGFVHNSMTYVEVSHTDHTVEGFIHHHVKSLSENTTAMALDVMVQTTCGDFRSTLTASDDEAATSNVTVTENQDVKQPSRFTTSTPNNGHICEASQDSLVVSPVKSPQENSVAVNSCISEKHVEQNFGDIRIRTSGQMKMNEICVTGELSRSVRNMNESAVVICPVQTDSSSTIDEMHATKLYEQHKMEESASETLDIRTVAGSCDNSKLLLCDFKIACDTGDKFKGQMVACDDNIDSEIQNNEAVDMSRIDDDTLVFEKSELLSDNQELDKRTNDLRSILKRKAEDNGINDIEIKQGRFEDDMVEDNILMDFDKSNSECPGSANLAQNDVELYNRKIQNDVHVVQNALNNTKKEGEINTDKVAAEERTLGVDYSKVQNDVTLVQDAAEFDKVVQNEEQMVQNILNNIEIEEERVQEDDTVIEEKTQVVDMVNDGLPNDSCGSENDTELYSEKVQKERQMFQNELNDMDIEEETDPNAKGAIEERIQDAGNEVPNDASMNQNGAVFPSEKVQNERQMVQIELNDVEIEEGRDPNVKVVIEENIYDTDNDGVQNDASMNQKDTELHTEKVQDEGQNELNDMEMYEGSMPNVQGMNEEKNHDTDNDVVQSSISIVQNDGKLTKEKVQNENQIIQNVPNDLVLEQGQHGIIMTKERTSNVVDIDSDAVRNYVDTMLQDAELDKEKAQNFMEIEEVRLQDNSGIIQGRVLSVVVYEGFINDGTIVQNDSGVDKEKVRSKECMIQTETKKHETEIQLGINTELDTKHHSQEMHQRNTQTECKSKQRIEQNSHSSLESNTENLKSSTVDTKKQKHATDITNFAASFCDMSKTTVENLVPSSENCAGSNVLEKFPGMQFKNSVRITRYSCDYEQGNMTDNGVSEIVRPISSEKVGNIDVISSQEMKDACISPSQSLFSQDDQRPHFVENETVSHLDSSETDTSSEEEQIKGIIPETDRGSEGDGREISKDHSENQNIFACESSETLESYGNKQKLHTNIAAMINGVHADSSQVKVENSPEKCHAEGDDYSDDDEENVIDKDDFFKVIGLQSSVSQTGESSPGVYLTSSPQLETLPPGIYTLGHEVNFARASHVTFSSVNSANDNRAQMDYEADSNQENNHDCLFKVPSSPNQIVPRKGSWETGKRHSLTDALPGTSDGANEQLTAFNASSGKNCDNDTVFRSLLSGTAHSCDSSSTNEVNYECNEANITRRTAVASPASYESQLIHLHDVSYHSPMPDNDSQSKTSQTSDFKDDEELCLVWSQDDSSTDKTSSFEEDWDETAYYKLEISETNNLEDVNVNKTESGRAVICEKKSIATGFINNKGAKTGDEDEQKNKDVEFATIEEHVHDLMTICEKDITGKAKMESKNKHVIEETSDGTNSFVSAKSFNDSKDATSCGAEVSHLKTCRDEIRVLADVREEIKHCSTSTENHKSVCDERNVKQVDIENQEIDYHMIDLSSSSVSRTIDMDDEATSSQGFEVADVLSDSDCYENPIHIKGQPEFDFFDDDYQIKDLDNEQPKKNDSWTAEDVSPVASLLKRKCKETNLITDRIVSLKTSIPGVCLESCNSINIRNGSKETGLESQRMEKTECFPENADETKDTNGQRESSNFFSSLKVKHIKRKCDECPDKAGKKAKVDKHSVLLEASFSVESQL